MVQLKDRFVHADDARHTTRRLVSAQKCLRAGGKHNDLDMVGFTARHHTFFEMLGNFSVGDYFKEEAIVMAWSYLTQELQLSPDKLRVSVFTTDDESARLWEKVTGWKETSGRIVRFGEADNFWSMGDEPGLPCGPCTEIFYDLGEKVDGDNWLEVWNLVFMQHLTTAEPGKLDALVRPSVDTGMGLERIASVMQGVKTNYDTDLFKHLLHDARSLVHKHGGVVDEAALRVVVDHLRAVGFLVSEGVMPSNVGRGNVLRRIIRRAVRFGSKVGLNDEPFLAELYPSLVREMGDEYPELAQRERAVRSVIETEERTFMRVFRDGLRLFESELSKSSSAARVVPGELAFRLYDSMGFPLDLTELIAGERGLTVDVPTFERLMAEQRDRSRQLTSTASVASSGGAAGLPAEVQRWGAVGKVSPELTQFTGRQRLVEPDAKVLAAHGDEAASYVVLDRCPFFGASGGQVGDQGWLDVAGRCVRVTDALVLSMEGGDATVLVTDGPVEVEEGAVVGAHVDAEHRQRVSVHHTATHLLHSALKEVVGPDAVQAGSLVDSTRLRFDFSSLKPLGAEGIAAVEQHVNNVARYGSPVETLVMPRDQALDMEVEAHFGEKYGDQVRVVQAGQLSRELCGGTHVQDVRDCYPFKITSEGSVAAGTRRVEAVAGEAGVELLLARSDALQRVANVVQAPADDAVVDAVKVLAEDRLAQRRQVRQLQRRLEDSLTSAATTTQVECGGKVRAVVHSGCDEGNMKLLRKRADAARDSDPDAVHVIVCSDSGKCVVACGPGVEVSAGSVFKSLLAAGVQGKGGGSATLAQGVLEPAAESKESLGDRIARALSNVNL